MKLLFLFSIIFSTSVFARCEIYTRYGEATEICWIQEFKGYFSERCRGKCEARTFLEKKMSRPASIDRTGGKNPAAQYCKAFGYSVAILKNPRMSEQSFCEFPDGSLVDTNAVVRSLK
jgi:putative hemolysin